MRAAAACEVPPSDTTPPRLQSASVDGATVNVAFDEDVAVDGASFAVRVDGAARTLQSATASGKTVVLALAQPVAGDDVIALDYAGGVKDAAGNAAAPVSNVVVA